MRQPNITRVSRKHGITLYSSGSWQMRYWIYGQWDVSEQLACNGVQYALDFAALRLRSTEALIVVLSAITGYPIVDFDEKAVRQLVREANKTWEFVT